MRKQWLVTLLALLLIVALAACGGDETPPPDNASTNDEPAAETSTDDQSNDSAADSESQAAPVSVDDLPDYGLEEGGYTLSFTGDLETGDGYTGTRATSVMYDPFTGGTADSGPMNITLRWDGLIDGERVDLNVNIVLSDDITTGTHPIGPSIDEESTFRARAYVDVDAMGVEDFNQDATGAVTLDSIDRQYANGTFQFTASTESGQTVTVSGSFHAIPFESD